MNKKIVFTCVLLVMLALITTGCKLPASGNPPAPNTSVPLAPTSTSGVAAEPTNTTLPSTPVVETPTSVPPSAVPPTAVPPTSVPPSPVPPTPAPPPQASRIQFVVGGTSAVVNGEVESGQMVYYVLQASASQTMILKVQTPNGDVYLGVFGADQTELLNSSAQETVWSGVLPATQDYYVSLTAGVGKTSYSLSVEIPPLAAGPTANITPVPGGFDPVATYGTPTYTDPMTGENINDWVNPTTGLLPDTKYIKITETNQKFYVTGKQAGWSTWYFTWHELDDFYLESIFNSGNCSSKDAYGLIVRGPEHQAGVSYGYVVSFSCDGQLWVFRLDSANPFTTKDLVSWTHSDYISAGANVQNVMGIKAVGNKLTIYANGHQIAEVTDDTYKEGRYGVFVSPERTTNYAYQVVKMSYWDLTP
jgi:hypothetical protein